MKILVERIIVYTFIALLGILAVLSIFKVRKIEKRILIIEMLVDDFKNRHSQIMTDLNYNNARIDEAKEAQSKNTNRIKREIMTLQSNFNSTFQQGKNYAEMPGPNEEVDSMYNKIKLRIKK